MTMQVAGADVWKGQWVVVTLEDGHFTRAFVERTLDAAVAKLSDAIAIGIDMPIGLPSAGERRPADLEAREFVGVRRNSVFLTPSQALLAMESLGEANRLARKEGWPGIAAQAFALKKQILAVQPIATVDERIWEVHPEVSFTQANDGIPLEWPKSCWNGVAQRREILETHGIFVPNHLGPRGKADAADVLDATIAAWSAMRLAGKAGASFPKDAGRIGAIWR
jgi:predicted RNase H-like nuclease